MGRLETLLEAAPRPVSTWREGDGVWIRTPDATLFLDPRTYRCRGEICPLELVEVISNTGGYVVVSLPSPGPGRTRHLRIGSSLSWSERQWLVRVLRAAVERRRSYLTGSDTVPEAMRRLLRMRGRLRR
ncbi:MAG: hypothetical protein KTR31_10405 [Myxococcales bacterium]|nr:hypothetical protein [Myxococcales bacterium]